MASGVFCVGVVSAQAGSQKSFGNCSGSYQPDDRTAGRCSKIEVRRFAQTRAADVETTGSVVIPRSVIDELMKNELMKSRVNSL
jgi:hypothetical protein